MIDTRQHAAAEELAVVEHAAYGNTPKTDAVISLFAPDEPVTRAFAAHAMESDRNLERRVYGFGTRVREEHVIQIARRDLGESLGKFELCRMAHLKWRRIVE